MRAISALPLLVLGGTLADHAHYTLAFDHLAVLADGLHTRTNLHTVLPEAGFRGKLQNIEPPHRYRKANCYPEMRISVRLQRPSPNA
jgi:hypothetical protein